MLLVNTVGARSPSWVPRRPAHLGIEPSLSPCFLVWVLWGHILGYPSGASLWPRLCWGRMCLLHPHAEGGLGPSVLIVWESQGTLVSPGRVPWSSYISWDWERGGGERVGWLVTHMC